MPDAVEFVKIMKRAAIEAVESSKPVNIYFGEVTSVSPLKISIEQKMVLGKAQLILSEKVTDFTTQMTVDWESEEASENDAHTHVIVGKKKITIHNALRVGDEVILLRQQEGQKYIVIDRIGGR